MEGVGQQMENCNMSSKQYVQQEKADHCVAIYNCVFALPEGAVHPPGSRAEDTG